MHIIIFLCLIFFSNQILALAQPKLAPGISYQFHNNDLNVYIDQNTLVKSIPQLQKKGIIDKNLSHTEMNFYQPVIAAIVSINYVTKLLKEIYSLDSAIDTINVTAYLISPDYYGNNQQSKCYSFDFNRKTYEQINWKKFQPTNIRYVASHFTTSDLCQGLIGIESTSF